MMERERQWCGVARCGYQPIRLAGGLLALLPVERERESRPALGVWDGGRERREEESYTSWSLKKSSFVARVTR